MYLRSTSLIALLGLILATTLRLPAQEPPPTVNDAGAERILTEEQLVQMALQRNRKLQSLQTNIDIATHRYQSSGRLPNPELRFRDLQLSHRDERYREKQLGLRFSVPELGELREDRQQEAVRLWDRKVEQERYYQKLRARIRRDVANVIMYDQLLELAAQRVELENRRIAIVENMVGIGERSVVYFTKAKMWHAESKNDYALAQQNHLLARNKLAKDTGVNPDVQIKAAPIPESNIELEQLIAIALQNRPEIELVNQHIALGYRQKRLENLKVLPWFEFVELNYHAERERRVDWVELMIGIELPLFDWNRGNRQATGLAVRKKEEEYDAIRETIDEEVRTAYTIYRDLLLDWQNFQRDAQQLIAEASTVVEQARTHKTLRPDEVLEMEITIIDTQMLLTQRRRNLVLAHIDLQNALGVAEFHSPSKEEP